MVRGWKERRYAQHKGADRPICIFCVPARHRSIVGRDVRQGIDTCGARRIGIQPILEDLLIDDVVPVRSARLPVKSSRVALEGPRIVAQLSQFGLPLRRSAIWRGSRAQLTPRREQPSLPASGKGRDRINSCPSALPWRDIDRAGPV